MNKILNVLLHVDDIENWDQVCKSANELLKMSELGNYTLNLEIIVDGDAVKDLAIGALNVLTLKENLEKFYNKGVYIYCCSSALQEYGVDPSVIFPFVEFVPSAVFHIALRSNANFSYIKP